MFDTLALHERLLKALAENDYHQPTEVQSQAIPAALEGRDLLVTAQTGSGKTAAYLLPLLQRLLDQPSPKSSARALVLVPTRELATQVEQNLAQLAQFTFLKGDTVCGGETFKPQAARLRKNPEVLIATPGRMLEHLDKQTLTLDDIELLVLDEADRMLDMGFQEDVMRIANSCPANRQSLLFSATLSKQGMGAVIETALNDPKTLALHSHREAHSAITHQIIPSADEALKDRQLVWLLQRESYTKAIVFTNTIAQAIRLSGVLSNQQIRAGILHGDLTQEQRQQAMQQFKAGRNNVLIATDVAARGLDVKEIELVINRDMARSGDDYIHRTGRTARAGEEGLAISLILPTEWNLMSSIERYLKARFEKRQIKGLEGSYSGPKKLKASGKAAGTKKKKTDKKALGKDKKRKPSVKKPARKGAPKRPSGPVDDGMAPLKRRPS